MPSDPRTIESYNEHATFLYDKAVFSPDASIYKDHYEKPALWAELPDLHDLSILCIGCASGEDAQWLLDNGAGSVTAIDLSSAFIKVAKREHPGIDFRVMDMERLDFGDNSFDLVCSSLAIHYVDDMAQSLKEAHRVLRPDGKYIFSCGHPLGTAEGFFKDDRTKAVHVDSEAIKDTGISIVNGDYLAVAGNGTRAIDGKLGEISVRVYHRTFSKMLEQIQDSGFSVDRMIEPVPTEEMRQIDPNVYEKLMKVPSLMIWNLRK